MFVLSGASRTDDMNPFETLCGFCAHLVQRNQLRFLIVCTFPSAYDVMIIIPCCCCCCAPPAHTCSFIRSP